MLIVLTRDLVTPTTERGLHFDERKVLLVTKQLRKNVNIYKHEIEIFPYKLCPVWRITSGAIQYGVPFIDLAPFIVACRNIRPLVMTTKFL